MYDLVSSIHIGYEGKVSRVIELTGRGDFRMDSS